MSVSRTTLTLDPWQCITQYITQYFDVPKPTGNLHDAIASYNGEVNKACLAAAVGYEKRACTMSNPTLWCGFTTAALSDVLSNYSTYACLRGRVVLDGRELNHVHPVYQLCRCLGETRPGRARVAQDGHGSRRLLPGGACSDLDRDDSAGCDSIRHRRVGNDKRQRRARPTSSVAAALLGPLPR